MKTAIVEFGLPTTMVRIRLKRMTFVVFLIVNQSTKSIYLIFCLLVYEIHYILIVSITKKDTILDSFTIVILKGRIKNSQLHSAVFPSSHSIRQSRVLTVSLTRLYYKLFQKSTQINLRRIFNVLDIAAFLIKFGNLLRK